jgi:hypothetical protein
MVLRLFIDHLPLFAPNHACCWLFNLLFTLCTLRQGHPPAWAKPLRGLSFAWLARGWPMRGAAKCWPGPMRKRGGAQVAGSVFRYSGLKKSNRILS